MTALNISVAHSLDDAEEPAALGKCNATSTDLDFYAALDEWVGCRFQNVTIPPNATIDTCIIRFTAKTARGGVTCHRQDIACEDHDDAPAFVHDAVDNIPNRTRTTAQTIDWTPIGVIPDATIDTDDFTASLQEVIDRPGWASGQAIVVIFKGSGPETNFLDAHSYDHGSAYPQIRITYTPAVAGYALIF